MQVSSSFDEEDMIMSNPRQLLQMRRIATALLLVMAVILALSCFFHSRWTGFAVLRAFAEAALVGGFADWFAVSALFRHPFGIAIPHTAIIPRNKIRIAKGLGDFISSNFLTKNVISQHLRNFSPAAKLGRLLQNPEKCDLLAEWFLRMLPALADSLDNEKFRHFMGDRVKDIAFSVEVIPVLAMTGLALRKRQFHMVLFDKILTIVEEFIGKHQSEFQEGTANRSFRWVPRWVDGKIGQMLVSSLQELLRGLRDVNHPWREEFDNNLKEWLETICQDQALIEKGEAIKAELLEDPMLAVNCAEFWYQGFSHIRTLHKEPDTKNHVIQWLSQFGEKLASDTSLRNRIDRGLLVLIERYALPRRQIIGAFITSIVSRWETGMLVEKLENQVGTDLQYIRINGTLVGGAVGLILHFLTGG